MLYYLVLSHLGFRGFRNLGVALIIARASVPRPWREVDASTGGGGAWAAVDGPCWIRVVLESEGPATLATP